jgi:hypothetical protein
VAVLTRSSVTYLLIRAYALVQDGERVILSELGSVWRRSSRSQYNACVEVRFQGDRVPVRNSRDPDGPVLVFTASEWDAFVAGVKLGEFDRPAAS